VALLVNVEFLHVDASGSTILAQRGAYVLMPSVMLSQALVLPHLALHVSSDKRSRRSFPLQVSSLGKETFTPSAVTPAFWVYSYSYFSHVENLQKPLATIRVPPLPIRDHQCGTKKCMAGLQADSGIHPYNWLRPLHLWRHPK